MARPIGSKNVKVKDKRSIKKAIGNRYPETH